MRLRQRFANVEVELCVLLLSAEEAVESEEVTTKITHMLNVLFLHADINKKENFIVPNIILLTKAASQAVLQHEIIWVHIGEFFMISGPRTLHTKLQKMQLSFIHTTTFYHNCNDFFNSFLYGQQFLQRFFQKDLCENLCSVRGPLGKQSRQPNCDT